MILKMTGWTYLESGSQGCFWIEVNFELKIFPISAKINFFQIWQKFQFHVLLKTFPKIISKSF